MQIQAINFKSLREQIAERLRELICTGELKPGDCLRDTELSGLLNTSRGPVREALLQLEKESLVRNIHNRGWFVIELSGEEVSQLISLRVALEAVALREAAKHLTPPAMAEVHRRYQLLFDLARCDEMVKLLRADFEFHQHIWGIAGHSLLREELIRISTPYFAYLQATIRQSPVPAEHFETTARQHQKIVDYLQHPGRYSVEDVLTEHFRTLGVTGWDRLLVHPASGRHRPEGQSGAGSAGS